MILMNLLIAIIFVIYFCVTLYISTDFYSTIEISSNILELIYRRHYYIANEIIKLKQAAITNQTFFLEEMDELGYYTYYYQESLKIEQGFSELERNPSSNFANFFDALAQFNSNQLCQAIQNHIDYQCKKIKGFYLLFN
jgi:hypothetical protein